MPQSLPRFMAPLAVLAMLAAAGCGGGSSKQVSTATGGNSAADALLKTFATHMLAAGSVHVEQTGAEDVTGDFAVEGAYTDFDISISTAGSADPTFVLRATHGTVYVSIPAQTGAGKFAKVDPNAGTGAALLASVTGMQPGKSLIAVAPAVESVRDAGAVSIGQQSTEHYIFRLDSLKAHELLNPGVTVSNTVMNGVPKVYDYNLYVTSDNLVRRVTINLLGEVTVIDYTRWGSAIHVTAPAPADLVAAPPGF